MTSANIVFYVAEIAASSVLYFCSTATRRTPKTLLWHKIHANRLKTTMELVVELSGDNYAFSEKKLSFFWWVWGSV